MISIVSGIKNMQILKNPDLQLLIKRICFRQK